MNRFLTNREAQKLGVLWKNNFKRCPIHYNKSGLYLIEFVDGVIKVGISKRLKNRLKEYDSPKYPKISKVVCYAAANPARLERLVCQYFHKFQAFFNSREFFERIKFSQILRFIEKDQCYKSNLSSATVAIKSNN